MHLFHTMYYVGRGREGCICFTLCITQEIGGCICFTLCIRQEEVGGMHLFHIMYYVGGGRGMHLFHTMYQVGGRGDASVSHYVLCRRQGDASVSHYVLSRGDASVSHYVLSHSFGCMVHKDLCLSYKIAFIHTLIPGAIHLQILPEETCNLASTNLTTRLSILKLLGHFKFITSIEVYVYNKRKNLMFSKFKNLGWSSQKYLSLSFDVSQQSKRCDWLSEQCEKYDWLSEQSAM